MNYYVAELSEIIIAQRHDEEQIQKLVEEFSQFFKFIFGDLLWIRYYRYFSNICRFFYYSSTTLMSEFHKLIVLNKIFLR